MATELTADILASCLPREVYIGKHRSECHVAICDFSQGRLTWTMDSNKKTCPPTGKFYDSFFAFSDFANQVDSMAVRYTVMKETEVKINQFAKAIQKRWSFNKFVLGCKVADLPILLSSLGPGGNVMLTLKSLFEYEQQANIKHVREAIHSMEWFLRKMKIFEVPGQTLLDITHDMLLHCMEQIDANYPRDRAKLHAVYHDEGKADVGTAISLADRTDVPPISALRYLLEVEAMKDPDYARRVVSDARMAKFSPKVNQ